MAPVLSFWDCGEFIAVAATLGIPHPPGTPLYLLISRIFTLIPLFADISARVNFLSALSSAFTAMFGYLVAVRLLRPWFANRQSLYSKLLIYGGAASGALFMAWGFTQWNNSIEAEVYGVSMFLLMFSLWLLTIYVEHWGSKTADRIMLLIVYLATLGIGVHMMTFVIVPVAALFFVLRKDTPMSAWFLVAFFFVLELFLIFALSSRPDEIGYHIPVTIVAIFYAFYMFSFDTMPRRLLVFAAGFAVAMLPTFWSLVTSVTRGEASRIPAAVTFIGVAGLLLTAVYGVYCLRLYWLRRSDAARDFHLLYPSLFAIVALLLSIIVFLDIQGYEAFLILSVVLFLGLGLTIRSHLRWLNLIALLAVGMVIISLEPFFWGVIIAAAVIVILGRFLPRESWSTALMLLVVAVMGFSVHAIIPVRSAQDPFINQNDPATSLTATVNFIERKQYGSENMVERMFKRRGEWEHQFGLYRRMGFWHFFHQQYGLTGPKFLILFVVALFGLWELIRRRPPLGLVFLVLLLLCTVGLVLYMNFADGTRQLPTGQDYLEVRDRDYFFTAGFILFGLAIGMGLTAVIEFVRESISTFSRGPRFLILAVLPLFFALPGYALVGNYFECDRSRNYVPFDYGWNLLQSAEPNAVLFTNGDNDTFPLWCLQEAYGIRKDVRIVNLSLANAAWYNKQLEEYMGLDLGMTDEQIEDLHGIRLPDGRILRTPHFIIDALILNNWPRVPIDFSVTVGTMFRRFRGRPIDPFLELIGMSWRFTADTSGMRVSVDEAYNFLTDPEMFRYRGLNDPTVYKDETTLRVTRNMANTLLMVADTLRKAGDMERAEKLAWLAADKIPHNEDGIEFYSQLLADQNKIEELRALMASAPAPQNRYVAVSLAHSLRALDRNDEAERLLDSVLVVDPQFNRAFEELSRLYIQNDRYADMLAMIDRWLEYNPEDRQAQAMRIQIQQRMNQSQPDTDDTSAD